MAQKGGPCYRGQQLLDNAPCQAAVNRGSRALLFSKYRALLVPRGLDRLASASPSGRGGSAAALTERARTLKDKMITMSNYKVTVLGAGLAGCEAALWLAGKGVQVELYEQKPTHFSPAHKSEGFAELICSNSLKAERLDSASGLLKEEMRRMAVSS